MNRAALALSLALASPAIADEGAPRPGTDMLRFSSGDQPQGKFGGISKDGRVLWRRDDVVLMTNGTDRFSGELTSIDAGIAHLRGNYANLRIPLGEIAEIHLARESRREIAESHDDRVTVHFQPVGRLTGALGSTGDAGLAFESSLIGPLELDLDSALFLSFESTASFLNFWDEEL